MSLHESVDPTESEAGPSTLRLSAAAEKSPYLTTSQYRHWRYSRAQLLDLRQELNKRSKEVTESNMELEKAAQKSMGHQTPSLPPAAEYLSVDEELVLLRFYCAQCSIICRKGFGLPEVVEATAISYLKRFYLKNSLMEWHPKTIMPTCLFLAAKTTNHPIPLKAFVPKFSKLENKDITDTEFLLAQSLSFEFWIRGAERALRGWGLELQSMSDNVQAIQARLPEALNHLTTSRLTDAEFLYSPSQIALACFRLADPQLVDSFLDLRYAGAGEDGEPDDNNEDDAAEEDSRSAGNVKDKDGAEGVKGAESNGDGDAQDVPLYGVERERLWEILKEIGEMISLVREEDKPKVKDIDKRLRGCTNPEKIPGTALYTKRKQEQEAAVAQAKAAKIKLKKPDDNVFGDVLDIRKPLSPRVSLGQDREYPSKHREGPQVGPEDLEIAVKDEGSGLALNPKGLGDVGAELDDDDDY